jgi:hypothetical protein
MATQQGKKKQKRVVRSTRTRCRTHEVQGTQGFLLHLSIAFRRLARITAQRARKIWIVDYPKYTKKTQP